ncbi:hypothetical protein Cni_G01981 [Canna indica]|uniref:RNase H type-1 domain-containing protein n=1 Tax=Canna indica TaxID=4628 RepID=A0AAQ3JP75_9LILI|nr:hypothetical protein Cni_G01981 [Canna indica]
MTEKDVEQIIKENWHQVSNSMNGVGSNLHKLSGKLIAWAKSNIDQLEKNMKEAKAELTLLDQLDETGGCNDQDICRMRSLANRIMALNRQIHLKWWFKARLKWRSKARVKWLEENDKNTKFFHNLAKHRKFKNSINSICHEGIVISEPPEEDTVALDHPEWRIAESLKWKRLQNRNKIHLCNDFSMEEILVAANSLGKGKAPGPDGFNIEFFIRYWDITKDSILMAIKEFTSIATLPMSWGETKLVFIPKDERPTSVTDYRPIALCNVIYKGEGSYVILNDAAWKSKEEKTGLGACILDMEGNIIDQVHSTKCVNSPLEAELWEIWVGIQKTKELKVNDTVVLRLSQSHKYSQQKRQTAMVFVKPD